MFIIARVLTFKKAKLVEFWVIRCDFTWKTYVFWQRNITLYHIVALVFEIVRSHFQRLNSTWGDLGRVESLVYELSLFVLCRAIITPDIMQCQSLICGMK